jgi:hypothetical protein
MDLEQIRGSIYVKIMSDKTRHEQPQSQSAQKVETGNGQRSKRPRPFTSVEADGIRLYFKSSTRKYSRAWGCLRAAVRESCPPASSRRSSSGREIFFAGVRAARSGGQDVQAPKINLEGLAAAESGFEVVPPFELITFIRFPTQEDDAAVAHRREIDQSL